MNQKIRLGLVAAAAMLVMQCGPALAGKSMELRSANTYFNQGDMKQALEWYEKADQKESKEAQVYARLVELYAEQKRWKEMSAAFAKLDQCADKESDRKKYKSEASEIIDKLWMGLWNGSLEQTRQADAKLAEGDSAAVRDHYDQARARIVTALEILPDRVDFSKRMGDLYITEFNALYADAAGFPLLEKAAQVYDKLAAAYPDSVDYAVTLSQLTYNVRDYQATRAAVDRALLRHPEHAELLTFAAKSRIQLGLAMKNDKDEISPEGKSLMGEAVVYLDKAIAKNPNDAMLVYNQALLYRDMGDAKRALATFAKVEGLAPDRNDLLFDSWYSMAVLYFQDLPEAEQDAMKAAQYFEKCLNLQPENKGLMFNLGVSLIRTGIRDNMSRGKALMEKGGE
jgi:tetratricopeptide (TPR) repeat protein